MMYKQLKHGPVLLLHRKAYVQYLYLDVCVCLQERLRHVECRGQVGILCAMPALYVVTSRMEAS